MTSVKKKKPCKVLYTFGSCHHSLVFVTCTGERVLSSEEREHIPLDEQLNLLLDKLDMANAATPTSNPHRMYLLCSVGTFCCFLCCSNRLSNYDMSNGVQFVKVGYIAVLGR